MWLSILWARMQLNSLDRKFKISVQLASGFKSLHMSVTSQNSGFNCFLKAWSVRSGTKWLKIYKFSKEHLSFTSSHSSIHQQAATTCTRWNFSHLTSHENISSFNLNRYRVYSTSEPLLIGEKSRSSYTQ